MRYPIAVGLLVDAVVWVAMFVTETSRPVGLLVILCGIVYFTAK